MHYVCIVLLYSFTVVYIIQIKWIIYEYSVSNCFKNANRPHFLWGLNEKYFRA